MKNIRNTILVAFLLFAGLTMPIRAKIATMSEALTVANNWISVTIQEKGGWGDANMAYVEDIQEFRRWRRMIGYFCNVKPRGFIVISLRRELAPVKAYSTRSNLDPECEEGMADLIKGRMEGILDTIEKLVGPVQTARTGDVANIVEIDYSSAWAELEGDISIVEWGLDSTQDDISTTNYQEGEILLTTNWSQGDPYNQDCPAPPGGDDCTNARCAVGCVATAGAQIMRYWCWPPYGSGSPYGDTYDWTNMPDIVAPNSPAAERNAVAELCHEIGVAVDMEYCDGEGCASSAYVEDMEGVYEGPYRYSDSCCKLERLDYDSEGWFDEMKIQLDNNQPIQYRIPGHSTVVDGWQVVGVQKQFHMNCGWAGGRPDKPCWSDYTDTNTWYTLNAIPCSDLAEEYMMVNIFPATSMRHVIAGIYPKAVFNFRYFNQDASGSSAIFAAGQNLQFLPDIVVSSTGAIKFGGNSRFYTRGDMSTGMRTDSGGISMYSGGQMKLY